MHHIINKQAVYDEVGSLVFHENCLFAVDCWVSVALHPFRDMDVPSSGCLFGSIDAFEKQEDMTFWCWFRPPVWRAEIYHVVSNLSPMSL